MPAIFIGHGNPMNAIEDNEYVRAWARLAEQLPRPKAILSISAHWLTEGSFVHTAARPKTIHDFWGFPEELYQVGYPCPGSPDLAGEIAALIGSATVESDRDWGLDHGSWVPLRHLFPQADIPALQLSIDISRPAQFHYRIGAELSRLREQGVLVMASGNIVHYLGRIRYDREAEPFDWAREFDGVARRLIEAGDHQSLIEYERLGGAALLSIPTPDHYWPLMYFLGLMQKGERVSFPVEGIAHGSVSMRAVTLGLPRHGG